MDVSQLIEKTAVDPGVYELRPDFAVLLIGIEGASNGPSDDRSRTWLSEAAESVSQAEDHPHVMAWREAYQAFGAKPKRFRPSVDALLRRSSTGLPEVNCLVDAYNAISVRHCLPIGGEDADGYVGHPRLVRAIGEETFETVVSGEAITEIVGAGEVVWRDDAGVTCRRWNWRQCVRTRVEEHSTNLWFLLERLEPLSLDELQIAGDELVALVRSVSPEAKVYVRLLKPLLIHQQ
ncbi:MAG: B3/B4 domain-containing protein [Candidatus Dormibacteraceae bacterium]